jgi:hypothetical protein
VIRSPSPSSASRHARSKIQNPEVSSTEGSEENEDRDLRLRHSFAIRHSSFVILLIRVVGEIRGQKFKKSKKSIDTLLRT